MPMPTNFRLVMYRGDSYQWTFRFWQDAEKTQPADLSEVTAKAAISVGAPPVAIPCVITLPNEITMTVAGSTWSMLAKGSGRWDLQLTQTTGWVTTPLAGDVSITADVTDGVWEYATR